MDAGRELPITVKLRSGLRPGEASGFALAHRLVEEAGAAAIAFHPRSAAVHHKGQPDYELVARLVQSLPAPVILTGGLGDAARAREAFAATGAAAVMLARGSLGNPWLFRALLSGEGEGRNEPNPRAQRSWTSCSGRSTAPSSTSASLARPGTCASSTRGTWHASGSTPPRPSAWASRCRRSRRWTRRGGFGARSDAGTRARLSAHTIPRHAGHARPRRSRPRSPVPSDTPPTPSAMQGGAILRHGRPGVSGFSGRLRMPPCSAILLRSPLPSGGQNSRSGAGLLRYRPATTNPD